MVIFFWGAKVYFAIAAMPAETLNIYVVGKQWMWKVQHASGQREINELHVPVGRPVKLIMTSEDVIHDFFIPAMRVKADVIPDSRADVVRADLTRNVSDFLAVLRHAHSAMIGRVVVEPSASTWLSGGVTGLLASTGRLFAVSPCNTCHRPRRPRAHARGSSAAISLRWQRRDGRRRCVRESMCSRRGVTAGSTPAGIPGLVPR
jgi:cytochrome c oxidase subunit 2